MDKNPKAIGNENEYEVIGIINECLGSDYKRTKRSGGADDPGDMKDFWKTTPLSKYTQETKKHESEKQFKKKILDDINQAIIQTPANRNWQLIEYLPGTDFHIVIMDLQDYLINDIIGQILINKKELKNRGNKIRVNLRILKDNIERLLEKL